MPRLRGIRQRYDNMFFDTATLEPGQRRDFFREHARSDADRFRTNIAAPERLISARGLASDAGAYVIMSVGVRILEASIEEERTLLDHIRLTVRVLDQTMLDVLGPNLSVLHPLLSLEEIERYRRGLAEHFEELSKLVASAPPWAKVKAPALPHPYPGFALGKPVVVPVKGNVRVALEAAPRLPRTITARACIFGRETADWD